MNKIKIMLTAVVLLSTVGGVLAFKAARTTSMCTAPTKASGVGQGTCGAGTAQNPYVDCSGPTENRKLTNVGALVCTAEPDPILICDQLCMVRTRTTTN